MRIKRGAEGKGKVPLFVRFVLDSIWDVYKVRLNLSVTTFFKRVTLQELKQNKMLLTSAMGICPLHCFLTGGNYN